MNTKRIVSIALSLIFLTSLFMGNYATARAQTASIDTVPFAAFGKREVLLDGPVDSTGFDFYLPADWSLTSGSTVHINMRAYVGDPAQVDAATSAAGYIDLYMNDTWLETVALSQNGDYSIDVNIPDTAWRAASTKLPQTLRIALHDAVRCSLVWASAGSGNWKSINVAISPTSYLYLPHQSVAMPTDLGQLPYPLYQRSFEVDKALVIVPEYPTEGELQAALVVEAALARMTDGNLITSFTNVSDLTETSLTATHVIFIGHPSAFPQLNGAALPLAPNGNTFEGQQVLPTDGILELIQSPVDPTKVWLIVSGNNDASIVKAAQAVGSGAIRPYGPSNLAIVTSVQSQPVAVSTISDITLADLGYKEDTQSAYGLVYFAYYFDVSPTQPVTDGAYFEMTYNNSALLNFEESGISILLNDQFVGSVRFNDRTTNASTVKFNIPAYMFRSGRNLLLLEANLAGMTPCIPVDEIWVSIKPGSLLHLPSLPVSDTLTPSYELASYPQIIFPSMDNLVFILMRDNPTTWEIAASIAYEIGQYTRNTVIQPHVAYADRIPDGILNENSQIIIGRPSTMPVIQDLAQVMPAPFTAGTDIATEASSEFTFNIPETAPVGYLQIMPSPWNSKQVIMTVLGNSDQGLRSASLALADNTIRSQMAGNLAVAYDNQVIVDKVELTPVTAIATPKVILQSTPVAANGSESGPFKLNLIVIGVGLLAVIVLLALVILTIKPKKPTG